MKETNKKSIKFKDMPNADRKFSAMMVLICFVIASSSMGWNIYEAKNGVAELTLPSWIAFIAIMFTVFFVAELIVGKSMIDLFTVNAGRNLSFFQFIIVIGIFIVFVFVFSYYESYLLTLGYDVDFGFDYFIDF